MENNGEVREKMKEWFHIRVPFPPCLCVHSVPHHPEEATLLQGKLWTAFAFLISFLLVVVDRTLTKILLLIFFLYSCVPYYLCDLDRS